MSSKAELIRKLERLAAPGSGATDGERRNALEAIARLRGVSVDSVTIEDEPIRIDDLEERYGCGFDAMTDEQLDELARAINKAVESFGMAAAEMAAACAQLAQTLSEAWENIPVEIRDYAERCYEAKQSTEMALPNR